MHAPSRNVGGATIVMGGGALAEKNSAEKTAEKMPKLPGKEGEGGRNSYGNVSGTSTPTPKPRKVDFGAGTTRFALRAQRDILTANERAEEAQKEAVLQQAAHPHHGRGRHSLS